MALLFLGRPGEGPGQITWNKSAGVGHDEIIQTHDASWTSLPC